MKVHRLFKATFAAVVACCLFASLPGWGQNAQAPPAEHQGHGRMWASPEERTDHLTKALNLSDDQKSKVLSTLQDEQKQMESVRSDSSLSREDRRAKMMQIHQNSSSQIKGVLNPDQAKKYDEMEQNMRQRHEHGGGGAPPSQQ